MVLAKVPPFIAPTCWGYISNFTTIMLFMQEKSKILHKAISKVITESRLKQGISYTDFCYENEISTSTYDNVINATKQTSFYNIAKIALALNMNFEQFGKLLDKELPKDFSLIDE